jgi:hypothetical protein
MDQLLGVMCRSVIRHAVVGVLTGGIGNTLIMIGDALDAIDAMDAIGLNDTSNQSYDYSADNSSTSSNEPHFGGEKDCFILPLSRCLLSSSPEWTLFALVS